MLDCRVGLPLKMEFKASGHEYRSRGWRSGDPDTNITLKSLFPRLFHSMDEIKTLPLCLFNGAHTGLTFHYVKYETHTHIHT